MSKGVTIKVEQLIAGMSQGFGATLKPSEAMALCDHIKALQERAERYRNQRDNLAALVESQDKVITENLIEHERETETLFKSFKPISREEFSKGLMRFNTDLDRFDWLAENNYIKDKDND